MKVLGKHLLNDLYSKDVSLSPIIVIFDNTKTIYDTDRTIAVLTSKTHKYLQLQYAKNVDGDYDNSGITVYESYNSGNERNVKCVRPSIKKISNIKVSSDYDTKKLKINRLRCTLYNYYDENTKLSEILNDNIINKSLHLFYKTPSSNICRCYDGIEDFSWTAGPLGMDHRDCATMYAGEISRIKYDDDQIQITAEDRTQVKFGNKNVPYLTIDKLQSNIQDNIVDAYKDDNAVVPMTFGKVDKAPLISYKNPENVKSLKLLLDQHPTTGHYRTAKVPILFDATPNNRDYYLYSLEGDDYAILDHANVTDNYQSLSPSYLQLMDSTTENSDAIIQEIQLAGDSYVNNTFKNWDFLGFYQRTVDSYIVNKRPFHLIAGVPNQSGDYSYPPDNLSNMELGNFENLEVINDNNNYGNRWFNQYENITANPVDFDTGLMVNPVGMNDIQSCDFYIILKLSNAPDLDLYTLDVNEVANTHWHFLKGNTFFLADWYLYGDTADFAVDGSAGINVMPLDLDKFKSWTQLPFSGNYAFYVKEHRNYHFISDEALIESLNDEDVSIYALIGDSPEPYNEHFKEATVEKHYPQYKNMYWGSKGNQYDGSNGVPIEWRHPRGLVYGNIEGARRQGSLDTYDYMVVKHESNSGMWNFNYDLGVKLNNVAFLHSVVVPEIDTKKLFASIIGRKNYGFTEQIDAEYFGNFGTDISSVDWEEFYSMISEGSQSSSDREEILNACWEVFNNTFARVFPSSDLQYEFPQVEQYTTEESLADYNTGGWSEVTNSFIINTGGYGDYNGEYQFTDAGYMQDWLTGGFDDILQEEFVAHQNNITSPFWNFSFFKNYIKKMIDFPLQRYKQAQAWAWTRRARHVDEYGSAIYLTPENYSNYIDGNYFFLESTSNEWNVNYPVLFYENWVKTILSHFFKTITLQNYTSDTPSWSRELVLQGSWKEAVFVNAEIGPEWDWFDESWTGTMQGYWGSTDRQTEPINITSSFENKMSEFPFDETSSIESVEEYYQKFYTSVDHLQNSVAGAMESFLNEISVEGTAPYDEINSSDTNIFYNLSEYEGIENNITDELSNLYISTYGEPEDGPFFNTDGILYKPSDIVMNIMVNEMGYGKYNVDDVLGENVIFPDYKRFDVSSIDKSRSAHQNWKMGFSVDKQINGKRLIEDILTESKSYPRFTSGGTFGLMTIEDDYSNISDVVDINRNYIIKYNFTQTRRENIITSVKMFYKYDYGKGKYMDYVEREIGDLIPEYDATGYDMYNIKKEDGHRDINLKYHTEYSTVSDFARYTLMNYCNSHLEVNLSLSLNYIQLEVGDIISLPSLKEETAFGINYLEETTINGVGVYPYFIVMEVNSNIDVVNIKAVQLHDLLGGIQ